MGNVDPGVVWKRSMDVAGVRGEKLAVITTEFGNHCSYGIAGALAADFDELAILGWMACGVRGRGSGSHCAKYDFGRCFLSRTETVEDSVAIPVKFCFQTEIIAEPQLNFSSRPWVFIRLPCFRSALRLGFVRLRCLHSAPPHLIERVLHERQLVGLPRQPIRLILIVAPLFEWREISHIVEEFVD